MLKRVITGAVLVVVVLLAIALQGWALTACLLAAALLSMHEMLSAFRQRGVRPVMWPAFAFAALSAVCYTRGLIPNWEAPGDSWMLYALGGCMLLAMMGVIARGKVDFEAMTASVLPLFYPGLLFAAVFRLANFESRAVTALMLATVFFVPSLNDVAALFVGMRLGRRRLSPEISPKKTVEGSLGGLIAAVVTAALLPILAEGLVRALPSEGFGQALPPLWAFALLGLVMGVFAQFGDLAASLIKRHCGIKDFGKIFPGHGGIMDRMDGVLFAALPCLIFFRLFGFN